jgi:hypothetical protein
MGNRGHGIYAHVQEVLDTDGATDKRVVNIEYTVLCSSTSPGLGQGIDKGIEEIFVDGGTRYITRELPLSTGGHGLELKFDQKATVIHHLEVFGMNSIWKPPT